jgi:hypothetical protein
MNAPFTKPQLLRLTENHVMQDCVDALVLIVSRLHDDDYNPKQRSDETTEEFAFEMMCELFTELENLLGDIIEDRELCILLRGELIGRKIAFNVLYKALKKKGMQDDVLELALQSIGMLVELIEYLLVSLHNIPRSKIPGIRPDIEYEHENRMHVRKTLQDILYFSAYYLAPGK